MNPLNDKNILNGYYNFIRWFFYIRLIIWVECFLDFCSYNVKKKLAWFNEK
jgi:hypothetical protein